ncbi:MAG: HAMP domain-containing histidine kinase [Candidatus Eremiobacteraeota bacterium]|nr:HAMP domain-containing histidine kinase [Candidatus Eremiobacteraeota bacterium]
MFRSLATRLTATYVFAAIVLVLIVVAAVTAFSLSMFGIASRTAMEAVARQAPFEARLGIARSGSLHAAAPDIVENLARPGLRVAVFATTGERGVFLAAADSVPGPDGRPRIVTARRGFGFDRSGPPGPPPVGPPPNEEFARHADRMRPYPFGLGGFLHIDPRTVAIPGGTVRIMPDPAPLDETIRAFLLAMIPIGIFAVAAAWLLGRYITGQALRPLVETTASLNRFGAGDFTPRPVVTTDRNESGELAKAYNSAAAQVTAAFEERRVADQHMRQFIADAGHELRTPLTVIMGFIDVLRRRAGNADPAAATSLKIYDTMLVESRRMKALIDRLIVLARLENVHERELETVDLGEVAGQVVAALQALETQPRIVLRNEAGAIVRGYESELHDAISNLVENALKYAPGSRVDIVVHGERDAAIVDVIDRGPGIPADEHERVFSRFFRGRDRNDAEGFGLGLAIAKRAVERSGGTISLESAPGAGSRFSIRVPRATRGEAVALAV